MADLVLASSCLWYASAALSALALLSSVWVAYLSLYHRMVVDEIETQIMGLIDDSLQLLIPTSVLNHISTADVANVEIKNDFVASLDNVKAATKNMRKRTEITYPEDLSKQLSEKSQMYRDFGESKRSTGPTTDVEDTTAPIVQNQIKANKMKPSWRKKSKEQENRPRASSKDKTEDRTPIKVQIGTPAPSYELANTMPTEKTMQSECPKKLPFVKTPIGSRDPVTPPMNTVLPRPPVTVEKKSEKRSVEKTVDVTSSEAGDIVTK